MEPLIDLQDLTSSFKAHNGQAWQVEKKISPEFEVQKYTSEEVFEELRDEWNDLVVLADSTVCMSLEWIQNWWYHFGLSPNRYLYVIAVRSSGRLIALAPFYIGVSRIGNRTIHKRLQLIGSGGSDNEQFGYSIDYGISDFLDICVHPDYQDDMGSLFIELLERLKRNFDTIKFHQVRDDSFIKRVLYPRIKEAHWSHELSHTDTCPFIDLKDQHSLEEYVKGVKSNARRRMRQTLRAMEKHHYFQLVDANNPERMTQATERLIQMHQERWNEQGYPGVFHDERFTAFFKSLIQLSFKNGWLWFNETLDEEGVSASRMLIYFNGRYYDYISGLNTASPSAKYRPGFGLLLQVVNDGLLHKANRIELLRGEERYKYDFTNLFFSNWTLSVAAHRKTNPSDKLFKWVLEILSLLYAISSKESKLLKVQYNSSGFIKMFPRYLAFRLESLKRKLKHR